MSGQGKLTIRPKPHLDMVLGWPGIPASEGRSRSAAHITGNIEVRLGSKGMKASWLRVELRKIETVPGGENWGELIGAGPIDVWSARSGSGNGDREQDKDGTKWEVLKSDDFPFRIEIPEALPPSAKLDKLCGIQYEVVASLCIKGKKGFFRQEETSSIMQTVYPVQLDKHEMHSTWPVYNNPDTHTGERDAMRAKLRRDRYCFAPGDKVRVKVIVATNRVEPAKLKSIAVTIKETVTFHGVKPSKRTTGTPAQPSMQRVEVITQKAKQVGKKLYKGDSKDYDLELVIPKTHALMSISTAKHIEVSYTMRLYVDIGKTPLVIDHVPMMMSTFPRQASLALMKKIGFVEGLSEREMVIDDDFDDDNSTLQGVSRMARAVPSRSLSVAGSSISGMGATNLQRRDTVLTDASGGLAGRGVPGQLYNYTPDGLVPIPLASPYMAGNEPRSAFLAQSGYDGMPRLTAQENTALYHHSDDPRNAVSMGLDYNAITSLSPPAASQTLPSRSHSVSPAMQRASFAGFPTRTPTISRHNSTDQSALAEAEREKERLYERARQQAERNQRRADEVRAAAAAAGGTYNGTMSTSHSGASMDGHATLPASEAEKTRLWERARQEAELYQTRYANGASFPAVDSTTNSRVHTPALPQIVEGDAIDDDAGRASTTAGLSGPTRKWRPMSMQVGQRSFGQSATPSVTVTAPTNYLSAEEEKRRLYDQARAETDADLRGQGTTNGVSASSSDPVRLNSVANGISSPPSQARQSLSALDEKEQMRRYYAAQEAVQRQRAQSPPVQASGTGSIAAPAPSTSSSQPLSDKEQMARYQAAQAEVQRQIAQNYDAQQASGMVAPPTSAISPPPAGLSEKEQLARYHAAQAEVQRHVSQQTTAGPSQNGVGASVPRATSTGIMSNGTGPSMNGGMRTTSPPANSALSEKEEMRQYLAARDLEAQSSGHAGGSGSGMASAAASATMASPRPVYAPNFHAMPLASPPLPQTSPSTTPLPQGAFAAAAYPSSMTAMANQPVKPRVVSDTPHSVYSSQRAASNRPTSALGLPPMNLLSLDQRGGTPSYQEGPWAPRVATPLWVDDGPHPSTTLNAAPPLPPKTLLTP